MDLPKADDYKHSIALDVRWGDMDRLGHVNNAKYFTYSESARMAYFDALKDQDPDSWNRCGLILANIGCDFIVQLHYPARIDIGTRITHIGRSSMKADQGIFRDGMAVARLHAAVVWFDYSAQKAMPVPDAVRELIRRQEGGQLDGPA